MDIDKEVLTVLDAALGLQGRGLRFSTETRLLGALPELDSLAMVALIGALEERFGIVVADEDIDGSLFATVGSLAAFVRPRLAT
ncbi:MAG: acyl carrier protein [Rhodocyclaceae bacterium]|nr:acyl carrier protein [Rhodocyclaceae bacterium]